MYKKVLIAKQQLRQKCGCNPVCTQCIKWESLIYQMFGAQIPVDYWFRKMSEFYGDQAFKDQIMDYINNIEENYNKGVSLYLAGERGRGKTMASCSILKKATLEGYSIMYYTLTDLVSKIIAQGYHILIEAKEVDFLVIDELDNRFFPTEKSMEMYGGYLESILRSRTQNYLPTIMCSNFVDISNLFQGEFKKSFLSLWSKNIKTLVVGGPDARQS